MFSTDPFFDEQAMRTLFHTQFGGADFGECMVTMQRVPPGDMAAWHREWLATADRVAAIGDACAAAGYRVSAREAYLRASNYYRTSYVPLFGAPPAPALVHAFDRESATFAAFAERATPPRWRFLTRGRRCRAISAGHRMSGGAGGSIRCPVFVAWEENDALAASAEEVYAALEGPKTLARFLAAEGAGDHCAMLGRSLFHQRMFDWLDGVLADDRAASRIAT